MKYAHVVAADPVRLYHLVTDVTRAPEWHPGVRRAEWRGQVDRARPGARFVVHPRSRLRRARHFEVTLAVPGRAFAFKEVSAGRRTDPARWTLSFDSKVDATELTCTVEAARVGTTEPARMLDRIAATAEGRVRVPQPQLGQAHTAEGPLHLSTMFVMHHGFRRDLRDLAAAVPATPLPDRAVWAALARRWERMVTTLHHHHQIEDESLWPPLLAQVDAVGDQVARRSLEEMQAEHAGLDPAVHACTRGFRSMTSAPDASVRDRLTADISEVRTRLLGHLEHEETAALPLAQRYLSVAGWDDFEYAARKEYGLKDLGFAVPWSTLEIPPDQFEIAYAHGGTLVRALLTLTRRRFEREHRTAFRHLEAASA